MSVEMNPVASSNVAAVGYDEEDHSLHVLFLNDRSYVYSDVPFEVFQELLHAPSVGSYLNRAIKGVYPYHQL